MRLVLLVSAVVTLFAVLTSNQEQEANRVQAVANQGPALEEAVSEGKPLSISLKDILGTNNEYEVYIEKSDGCRFLGRIKPADMKIIFVEVEGKTLMKKEKKQPIFYATAPYTKEELPDGRLKITYYTHKGAVITDIIPPQPSGTKFVGEIKKKD